MRLNRRFLVAITFVAEVGDVRRFATPQQLMAFLGLVPSERTTLDTVRRASITKTGNHRARRVLIEGAWTYRFSARVGETLRPAMRFQVHANADIAKADLGVAEANRDLAANQVDVAAATAFSASLDPDDPDSRYFEPEPQLGSVSDGGDGRPELHARAAE